MSKQCMLEKLFKYYFKCERKNSCHGLIPNPHIFTFEDRFLSRVLLKFSHLFSFIELCKNDIYLDFTSSFSAYGFYPFPILCGHLYITLKNTPLSLFQQKLFDMILAILFFHLILQKSMLLLWFEWKLFDVAFAIFNAWWSICFLFHSAIKKIQQNFLYFF